MRSGLLLLRGVCISIRYANDWRRVHAPPTISDDAVDHAAFSAARGICRREARGFYLATSFLPGAKRDAVCAVYALCMMLRDALSETGEDLTGARGMRNHPAVVGQTGSCCSSNEAEARLDMFRERLDTIYAGRLELPSPASRSQPQHALHAFAVTVGRHQVSREHFSALAESYRT